MKTFKEILSHHTGYSVGELLERKTEAILQPHDVFLAKKEWDEQVGLSDKFDTDNMAYTIKLYKNPNGIALFTITL